MDIVVGPDGFASPNTPCNGNGGIVVLGILWSGPREDGEWGHGRFTSTHRGVIRFGSEIRY